MNTLSGCDLYHKAGQSLTPAVALFDIHAGAGFKHGCCPAKKCGHGGECVDEYPVVPLKCGHGGECTNEEKKLACGHGGPCQPDAPKCGHGGKCADAAAL